MAWYWKVLSRSTADAPDNFCAGFPITYLAKGKQYVAMPAGTGGGSWSTLISSELAPEIRQPKSGNAILVFALP
jgi:hypothetical protein